MLLVDSGFIAATLTHERSPQPRLITETHVEEGGWQMYHLSFRHRSAAEYQASKWLSEHRSEEYPVYGTKESHRLSSFFYTEYDYRGRPLPGPSDSLYRNPDVIGNETAYIYIGWSSIRLGKAGELNPAFNSYPNVRFRTFEELRLGAGNRVYDSGRARTIMSQNDGN